MNNKLEKVVSLAAKENYTYAKLEISTMEKIQATRATNSGPRVLNLFGNEEELFSKHLSLSYVFTTTCSSKKY